MTLEMIQQYSRLMDFLGHVLGPDYEIVLHDFGKEQPSVVAIVNNKISGRTIGAPPTNIAMKIISERTYETQNYRLNYRGKTANGKVLRCSTFFIKNNHGELEGLLCINFDDSRYRELSQKVFSLCHPDEYIGCNITVGPVTPAADSNEQETFYNSIVAATEDALGAVMKNLNLPTDRLTQEEKMKIVAMLNEKGIFMLKGAVTEVAERLSCSQASIYRYLSKLTREKKQLSP